MTTVLDRLLAHRHGPAVKLKYGRHIVADWARLASDRLPEGPLEVLDVGCGAGDDLARVAAAVAPRRVSMHGLDGSSRHGERLAGAGIELRIADIEREPFPFEAGRFHYVVANQVLEHTKEIFWILAEVHRVLAPGGYLAVGVPNLASVHNRLLVALGREPTSARVVGPHVRTFTRPGLRSLLQAHGYFRVVAEAGAGFYPLGPRSATALAAAWIGGAVSVFALAEKTGKAGSFLEAVGPEMHESMFFTGGTDA